MLNPAPHWERVTVNRKDKTMKCENIAQNTDKTESLMAVQTFKETSNGETLNENKHFKGYEKSE